MNATHWSAYEKSEDWSDDPAPTPQEAVGQLADEIADDIAACHPAFLEAGQ